MNWKSRKLFRALDTRVQVVINIQALYRGHLGRKRFKTCKQLYHRMQYEKNFQSDASNLAYKFLSNGAALKIQHWFRNLPWRVKANWKKKHAKVVYKIQCQKRLLMAFRKSKGYNFRARTLDNPTKFHVACAIVMQRICRGRRGLLIFRRQKDLVIKRRHLQHHSAINIQKTVRMFVVRCHYPDIGVRYRMLRRKAHIWKLFTSQLLASHQSICVGSPSLQQEGLEIISWCRRRPSIFFPHLKLGDAVAMETLGKCAVRIQMVWKRFRVRLQIHRSLLNKHVVYVVRIQRWALVWMRRKKITKCLKIIQPLWRNKAGYRIRRRKAAIVLQNKFRSFSASKWYHKWLQQRNRSKVTLCRWRHRVVCLRRVRALLRSRRRGVELLAAGKSCHDATRLRWYVHFLWQGMRKTKNYEAPYEMQKIFCSYSVNGAMDPGKFVKLCRDCGLLQPSGGGGVSSSAAVGDGDGNTASSVSNGASFAAALSVGTLELQFAKVKIPTEKRIDYARFVDLLMNISMIVVLGMDPGRLPALGSATGTNPTSTTASSTLLPSVNQTENTGDEMEQAALSYSFAGQKGRSALVMSFVIKCMSSLAEFKEVAHFLNQKSAKAMSSNIISGAIASLHLFVKNRLYVRKMTKSLADIQLEKVNRRIYRASTTIQCLVRRFLGGRRIVRIAQTVYTKFLDGESDREYWSNSRTGNSFWTKPGLLGRFDCGMATRMPTKDEVFQVQCQVCAELSATW
jgi:hypothetical protein